MWAKMKKNNKMYKIEGNLWQGGRLNEELPKEIDAVLNLSNEPPEFEPGKKLWLWFPIDDGPFPGLKWLQMVVNVITDLLDADKTIYIHCAMGISRSTMVTAAYLMVKHTWDYDKALNFIAESNPLVDPNPNFIKGLKEWQKYIRSSSTK